MMRKITTRNVSVNMAKVVTILCLLSLPFFYEVHARQAIYLAMHVSYCVWYLLKQAILRETVFRERDSALELIMIVATVGVGYALPGWLAFRNTTAATTFELVASVTLFFFGSVINSGADVQKITALRLRPGLITDGFWGLSRNINYFGDLMRYSAMALLSGSAWSWLVVLVVLGNNVDRMQKKARSLSRYPEYAAYRSSVPALLPLGEVRHAKEAGMNINFEITVDAPVEEVFAYYLEEDHLQDWVCGGGMLEFTPLTQPPKRVGSRYRMAYCALGMTFRSITEVTALEPCRLSIKDQVSGDYKVWHYEMHFAPAGPGKTRMEMRAHAVLPWGPLGMIAGWLGRPLIQRDRQAALGHFKLQVEARMRQVPAEREKVSAL
ncbi:MAG TPA: SRPBCC family protein [Anaerolineales bacterium]|nr:SRPBCC family protein [Anaerolineales bacterium]